MREERNERRERERGEKRERERGERRERERGEEKEKEGGKRTASQFFVPELLPLYWRFVPPCDLGAKIHEPGYTEVSLWLHAAMQDTIKTIAAHRHRQFRPEQASSFTASQ